MGSVLACTSDFPADPNAAGSDPNEEAAMLTGTPSDEPSDTSNPSGVGGSGTSPGGADSGGERNPPPERGKACDDFYERNDSASEACQINLDTAIRAEIAPMTDTDDYFVFHVEAGVTYTLTLATLACLGGTSYSLGIEVTALGSQQPIGLVDAAQYYGRLGFYEFTPSSTGDAQLFLKGASSCPYVFDIVSPQSLERDELTFEPNNTPSTAAPLAASPAVAADVSVPEDPVDYYTFPVVAGTTYSLTVSSLDCVGGTSYSLDIELSSLGSGQPVAQLDTSQYFGRYTFYEFTPQSTGDASLRISALASCAYQFDIVDSATLMHADTTYEPNNTPSTAFVLAANPSITADVVLPEDPLDHYTFPVVAGTTYTLTVSTLTCVGGTSYSLRFEASSAVSGVDHLIDSIYFGRSGTFTIPASTTGDELLVISTSGSCTYTFDIQ
jgi:hypothetical protein